MICGIDEAGKGPVLGPLVIAGITIPEDTPLIRLGVRDSKKLTPKRREYLAKEIHTLINAYKSIIIPADDIDNMRKTMTLNEIEVNAFSKIIEELKPTTCYVDSADVNDIRFGKDILTRLSYKPTIVSKHKADETYPVVSAASILAKTTRDTEIKKIAQELEPKLNIPLGSGYPADQLTQKFLKTWIQTYGTLPPHTRQSWETAQKLIKEYKTKPLNKF